MRADTRALLKVATIFYAIVAGAAWGWAALFGDLDILFGEFDAGPGSLMKGLGAGLAIVAVCHLGYRFFRFVREASRVIGAFVGPVGPAAAVYLALLSGFVEELLFRGALWPQLGLVGSSILFGVLHTVPVRALAGYPVFAALAGLVFGVLREQSGSVFPPMVAHMVVNGINLTLLGASERRRPRPEPLPAPEPPPEQEPAEILVGGDDHFFKVDDTFPVTIWRYNLRVELRGTDRQSLPECLEHEELGLFEFVPRDEVYEQLRAGTLEFTRSFAGPYAAFPGDVATISTYLFQVVTGIEVAERYADEKTTDDVRAWKIVAQRGEWVKVPLMVTSPEAGIFEVDTESEDLEIVSAHWNDYPRWFQDGMRFKYPRLRDL